MSYSYQEIFDTCVHAIRKGRGDDASCTRCHCDCLVLERGCHIDALLGDERAKRYPGVPLCTGCLVAPYVGEREHRAGSALARELVEAGVPPTHVSSDLLDHFNFIHDLAGEDWKESVRDCVQNIGTRHRVYLDISSLEGETVH